MSKFKSFAAAIFALIAAIGALDAERVTSVFPADWGGIIAAILSTCAVLTHLWTGIGKTLAAPDPEKLRTPIGRIAPLLLAAAVLTLSLGMTSCAGDWSITSPYGRIDRTPDGTIFTPPATPVVIDRAK